MHRRMMTVGLAAALAMKLATPAIALQVNTRVAALAESRRAYRVLEDLNTKPAVRYLKAVRHDSTPNGIRRG